MIIAGVVALSLLVGCVFSSRRTSAEITSDSVSLSYEGDCASDGEVREMLNTWASTFEYRCPNTYAETKSWMASKVFCPNGEVSLYLRRPCR